MWQEGQLNNFDYLMYLNVMSNRSFNDLTSYPVFPWIIKEYVDTNEFNLNNPNFFRDLSKPIGAINLHRLQKLKQYYQDQLNDKNREIDPYLYSTHYSTPGLVVYFMIRKVPEFVIKLQNGVFGPTDRIFRGIDTTWSAAMNLDADFKELIPEFYNLDGDFLINSEQLELGITQDGEIIDDVVIPSWANNYHDLLSKMKMALECDYTSSHLNEWIDLIFGYKQTGEEAVLSDNLFYPYTYEHNVKWDQIENDYQKQAMKIQVQEFGQCPVQLFNQPHILRKVRIVNISQNADLNQIDVNYLMNKYMALSDENDRIVNEIKAIKDDNKNRIQNTKLQMQGSYNQQNRLQEKKIRNLQKQLNCLINYDDSFDNQELKKLEKLDDAKSIIKRQLILIQQLQQQINENQLQQQQELFQSKSFHDEDLNEDLQNFQITDQQNNQYQQEQIDFFDNSQDLNNQKPLKQDDFDFLNDSI